MQLYNLKNFYVGELYIPQQLGLSLKKELANKQVDSVLTKIDLESNGAIPIKGNNNNISFEKKIRYDGFLTIFYRNKNELICLHNGKTYNNSDNIKRSVPLENLLPKISYDIPKELSIRESLKIFKILFKENLIFNKTLFNDNKLPLDDFYVGTLKFCSEVSEPGENIYRNVIDKYMLYNNGAKELKCCIDGNYLKYIDIMFNCLLLKHNNKLLNLHNNQIYIESNSKDTLNMEVLYGKCTLFVESLCNLNDNQICEPESKDLVNRTLNYYQDILPFKNYLENKKLKYNENEISIPKALKLYKK